LKKKYLSLLLVVLLFSFSFSSFAVIKTIYRTNEPQEIITRLGTQTVLLFNTEIEFASVGNSNFFQIEEDKKMDKLIITPLSFGVSTNLIVITRDNTKYVFTLVEDDERDYYDLVIVKANADISYKDIINLVNKKRISIDPALMELIDIYDIEEKEYKITGKYAFVITAKRAVLIENLGKTVFWIRLHNFENSPNTLSIPLNSIRIKERDLFSVAGERNKEVLLPGEFGDYYIIVEGVYLDNSYTLQMSVNGQQREYVLDNIPYTKQEFSVFVAEDNDYYNVIIDDYRR
jgi:hypothetical protein